VVKNRHAQKVVVRKREGKRLLERPSRGRKDNIKRGF
jgi:hypothetical protein